MFDIGWSELLVVGVVALIAIGPKELPGVLRALGHWMGKVRRMASDFQDQFREAMREAEVADLKRQFDEASASATSAFSNPLETAQKEVEAALGSEPAPAIASAEQPAVTHGEEPTATPGIESGASAPSPEAPPPAAPQSPETVGDAPLDIKPDAAKTGGSGTP